MSSTEIRRTDGPATSVFPLVRLDQRLWRTFLATAVLLLCWMTLTLFAGGGQGSAPGETAPSNLMNQLGYSAAGALVLLTLATTVDSRLLVRMTSPAWAAMLALLVLSVFTTSDPAGAMRAVAFSLIAIVTAAGFVLLPPRPADLDRVFAISTLVVLVICYAGVILYPQAAVHQPGELEAQHAGLWRGLFIHKNIGGPVIASIGFVGIYLVRRGMTLTGLLITVLAFAFLSQTGSKTSSALAPFVAAMVLVPSFVGLRPLAAVAALAAIAGAHAMTIGTVFVPALDAILRLYDPLTTFTGRIEIWEFARDYILQRPLTGFGYDGFWLGPVALGAEQPFDRSWDPRAIVHGHNGYLDIALTMGLPALALVVWLTVLAPAGDYVRSTGSKATRQLSDLFFMIIVFIVMTSALESFFFRRADPVWMTLVIALFGLRMTARFTVPDDETPVRRPRLTLESDGPASQYRYQTKV